MLQGLYQESSFGVALVRSAGAGFTSRSRGCGTASVAPVTRAGVGDYTINLTVGIPSANCDTSASVIGTGNGTINIVHTSDTAKQVLIKSDAGAALDADFNVSFAQLTGG
jgi:hypothetical protein